MSHAPDGEYVPGPRYIKPDKCMTEIEQLKADNIRLQKELESAKAVLRVTAIRAFNIGTLHGHEDTVDGKFTIIMPQDLATYNSDLVDEMLNDSSLPGAFKYLTEPEGK